MVFFLYGNPFLEAFYGSDFLGKLIFIFLFMLSILSWSIIVFKLWVTKKVIHSSFSFQKAFLKHKNSPFSLSMPKQKNTDCPNAFYTIYKALKEKTYELFEKNGSEKPVLLASDIAMLDSSASASISALLKFLESNLYILSTVVTLSPFLGLLGTVYGILTTFSSMEMHSISSSSQTVLAGLSLALCTTVLGLLNAIPALIGYNYLKNKIAHFDTDMGHFATQMVSNIELCYRK